MTYTEMSLLTLERIKWAPVAQVVILCGGTTLCFLIAYLREDVSIYLPFISETGAHGPEMLLFSLTLIFGSMTGSLVICIRHVISRYRLLSCDERLKKFNVISTLIGLISMAGLAGVAAFPMSTILWVHLVAAGIHFVCYLIYVFLETLIVYYIPGGHNFWNKVRMALCGLLLIFLLLLVIFFPLSHFKWKATNDHPPAMKQPEDKVFGLMFCSSLFEWAMYSTMLAIILTFCSEFSGFHVSMDVVPTPPKSEIQSSS